MSKTRILTKDEFLATKPEWAKAAIFAEREVNESDLMTDYFSTGVTKKVFLGWSKHTKDLFAEMRKAAATFSETAHLGPGKDRYIVHVVTKDDIISNGAAYWKGTGSHWHSDIVGRDGAEFTTQADADAFVALAMENGGPEPISFDGKVATFELKITKESIEHREKWSMGAGYYLKASGRYSDGWKVRKTSYFGEAQFEVAA